MRLQNLIAPAILPVLFGIDGAIHIVDVPVVYAEYWLLQELYSGFASTRIGVLMLYVPSLLTLGVLFLVTALLVWKNRGHLFGAFLAFLSVPLNLLVIEAMQLSWISVAFSIVNILLNLLLLVNLFALKRSGVRNQSAE